MTETDDELEAILEDLERKGWAKRTETGWETTDIAKAMIEKYGEKKAMEFFAIEELEIEFHPDIFINKTIH